MYTVFLAGGIGSGKSTVASELERLGCHRIDLDQLSREVLEPGSQTLRDICAVFGNDLVDEADVLDRRLLAQRAFASPESAARLEEIELPAIEQLLCQRLSDLEKRPQPPSVCLVEVPLLDRMGNLSGVADEVVVVSCPLDLRRVRAVQRGMDARDFDARAAKQPTDEWLLAHADTVFDNSAGPEELLRQVHAWYESGEERGWV